MSIKLLSLFHAFGESDSKILGSVEIINSQLIGTGACLPDFVLTNAMLEHMVDTNDEWIVQRTGVRERRIAKNMHTWELALGAAQDALADAKIDAGELDLILVSTCTPDTNTPNTAAILQDKLGAGAIGAFDINNACTGFVSATDIADCYIKSGKARTVLVVSAETLSRIVDYTDRGTCILFGDGAAAAVYRATEDDNLGIQSTFIAADGSGAEYLRMEALPVEDPFAEDRTVDPKARFLKMQGAAVVRFTARAVPQAIDTALQRAGITADDIDWVVPHQANLRILDVIARRYHLPKEKVYVNMDRFGNTSSASVPICLNEMRRNGLLREGQTIVCTGFGGITDHFRIGIDEDRSTDAFGFEGGNDFAEEFLVRFGVPARIGSQRVVCVGYERHLCRQDLERQVDETVDGVAFHIQFGGDYLLQVADILVADVPLVGTRMHGDALCTEPFRIERCLHHVGNIPSARIAQCGDLVDVNTQLCHIFLYFCGVKDRKSVV